MIDRKWEKKRAKEIMSAARVSPFLFTAIYVAVNAVLNGVTMVTSSPELENVYIIGTYEIPVPTLITLPTAAVTFLSLLISLLLTTLMYGYYSYSMTVRAGNYAGYDTILDGFTYVGKVILLELGVYARVFLWTLLFIVPGIIAAYRYRFAAYNLCENPDLSPGEAIRMSKAQTQGLKWQLFVLDFSFLGWDLLVGLSAGLLNIYVIPYRVQTELGYYEYGKRASGVKPAPDPFTEDGQFHTFDI